MRRPIAPLTALLALALVGPPLAGAQAATPAASPIAADACTVAPRSADELIAIWSAPAATPPPGSAAATSTPAPAGEPADAATVAGITATARELVARANAGDFARLLALYTDALAAGFGPPPDQAEAEVRAALAQPPVPVPPEARQTLQGVSDVRVLPDGRVAASLAVGDPTTPAPPDTFLVFARVGDRWLVAEFRGQAPDEPASAAGTPSP
ncbi:MAG: hypothetical protein AVDCRST_MAG19-1079 [uncultured Thermomicrobiales bacterium]|uniref:DUF4440 domain-containing protein n=1 Tax=uncultured Thermomicrobiales bacterium TaxID=1645740 RepID=A0A6J4ULI7_9BACT|nr:MAG: hypothetical protein AVDCRST_MAG19-1079 [uncultured Thermomicrobiales bacterium]